VTDNEYLTCPYCERTVKEEDFDSHLNLSQCCIDHRVITNIIQAAATIFDFDSVGIHIDKGEARLYALSGDGHIACTTTDARGKELKTVFLELVIALLKEFCRQAMGQPPTHEPLEAFEDPEHYYRYMTPNSFCGSVELVIYNQPGYKCEFLAIGKKYRGDVH